MPAKLTPEEIGDRGRALYEAVRNAIPADRLGQFIVIDIVPGDYEVDEDDIMAEGCLLARRPDAVLYVMRVGCGPAWATGSHAR